MGIKYEKIKCWEPKIYPRNLIKISGDKELIASLEAFGPHSFKNNMKEMHKNYFHPKTGETITFREPTTAESILVASYDFINRVKSQIFDRQQLQAGRIFKAPEWVVINPPRDEQENFIKDEKTLKNYLNKAEKINGIYRIPNGKIEGVRDCSFVPYESFSQGNYQSSREFARSGIARGLEYTKGDVAPKLKIISAKTNYPKGVHVSGFNSEDKIKTVCLGSGIYSDNGKLLVCCDYWNKQHDYGYAFGVLDKLK